MYQHFQHGLNAIIIFLCCSHPHLSKDLELGWYMYVNTFGNVQTKYADIGGIFTMFNVLCIFKILAKIRIL